jgi:hypothetical protein
MNTGSGNPDVPRGAGGDEDGRGDEDIDAEFARMMRGLDLDESVPVDAPGTADAAEEQAFTIEDVLGDQAAEEDTEPAIAVVATSLASAKALAGAVRLGREARTDGIDIPVGTRMVDTPRGAIAVGALQEDAAHDLAAVVSTALQRHGVVLFWRRGDRMVATRYKEGERGDDVSPALVLGAMSDEVEQLLLGALDLEELPEGYDPSQLSRAEALKWISRGRRKR